VPLTAKGEKIMASLVEQYGEAKAKRIFYAGKNSGRFTGVDNETGDSVEPPVSRALPCEAIPSPALPRLAVPSQTAPGGCVVADEIGNARGNPMQFTEMVLFDQDQPRFKRTVDGYLAAQPRVARTGIQLYSPREVGKPEMDRMVRVYRPEEEVFNNDTIRSFAHRPVTLDHPSEMINDKNWKNYSVGHTVDPIVRDGEFVRCPVLLMDSEAIKAFEGGRNQLSMGYVCDLKWEPGVTEDNEPYDAVQTNLRMNHLAIVGSARGGDKLRIGDTDDTDEEFHDQDMVHCLDCDAVIPDDVETCPKCGYEMQDGDVRDYVLEDDLDRFTDAGFNDLTIPVASGNPYRQAGMRFAPKEGGGEGGGGGGGSSKARTRAPSTGSKKKDLEQVGYRFGVVRIKGGGGIRHQAAHPESGYSSGYVFHTHAEAVAHAEEHAKRTGQLQEPVHEPEAEAHPAQPPAQPPAQKKAHVPLSSEPDFFGPEPGGPPPPHSGQRQAAATAAAVGVAAPTHGEGHGEAPAKRGPGRPRKYPREGDPGYVAPGPKFGAAVAHAGGSAGRTSTFASHGEAMSYIRAQRRRWRWARPVPHGATFVAKRGLGFTRARIPGLRTKVSPGYYTLHHDAGDGAYDLSPWTIVFDEVLDLMPLADMDLTPVEDFNPNHDPETGEFTSGESSSIGASLLASSSRREAASATYSTPQKAKEQAAAQITAWKKHLASQEQAVREIKRNIALWEKAKIRSHVEYESKPGFIGLGTRQVAVRTHYTVHIDGLDALDAIPLTDVDLLQAKEWEQELLLANSSDPAMDEIAAWQANQEGQA
jgi:Uncharacterized protein conserved in bacteria (DUF2213)